MVNQASACSTVMNMPSPISANTLLFWTGSESDSCVTILQLYGCADYNAHWALIFSHTTPYTVFDGMSVGHDTARLDKFHLTGNNLYKDDLSFATSSSIDHLAGNHRMQLPCLQHDGHLLPKLKLRQ
ncbi:Uncharacterized protein HZ326_17247 [Fusarium oxysporum f. sp. albedinis]|nr:Uncharacterized protein HZ326_17247 [Fusarium oxysporum f. sp. albedinis]